MREILFKAKRIDNGEWVEGFYCKWIKGKRVITYSEKEVDCIITWMSNGGMQRFEVDQSTICQCTGLKDKNGKLIWENDVVKGAWFDKGKRHRHIGTVSYICCAYKVVGVKQYYGLHDELNGSYTVIGNIFDNADLLGE